MLTVARAYSFSGNKELSETATRRLDFYNDLNPGDDVPLRATLQRPTDLHHSSGILIIAGTMVVRLSKGEVE